MNGQETDKVNVLKLTLHGRLVGYLLGYLDGRNVIAFADEFKSDPQRPTFSLITHPRFPHSDKLLQESWQRRHKLHPTLSNLLPEGALRELIAQGLKIHIDNEFHLFAYLGEDLPGALIAKPLAPDEVPLYLLSARERTEVVTLDKAPPENKFSLAGIQMKFSMKHRDGRYALARGDVLGDWIIKTPSTRHKDVPLNEFTAMTLAALAGIDVPEMKLVDIGTLDNLPPVNLPAENPAFAIKRFDRDGNQRIHMEDFAQVLVKYPHEKYLSASYEQIGKILYQFSEDGLADAQQFARRLLVNILLANGDAHLKNWSLLYSDRITPRLSPAYDIVTTKVYIDNERQYALNLAKTREWHKVTYGHFGEWARRAEIPWRAIRPHLDDTMERARTLWPNALNNLPMNDKHKEALKRHWAELQRDFRI